jgi:predicted secreted hydrolase
MRRVRLPEDDRFLKDCGIQWWYWTGHLEAADGRRFGYEIVFWAFKKWGWFRNILAHQSLTELQAGRFLFDSWTRSFQLPSAHPEGALFAMSSDPACHVRARGGNGRDHLESWHEGFRLELDLLASKPPVVRYDGCAHPYVFGGYSWYYSRERMATTGTLRLGAEDLAVTGSSWFDRQYGELLPAISQGWDWFSIQLHDGSELMVFLFHGRHHPAETFGSLTGPEGRTRDLGPDDLRVSALDEWVSPNTGIRYPSHWRIRVPAMGLDLDVMAAVADQELHARHEFWPGPEYWEGACHVRDAAGQPVGDAYVELNGYSPLYLGTVDLD